MGIIWGSLGLHLHIGLVLLGRSISLALTSVLLWENRHGRQEMCILTALSFVEN